MKIHFVFVFFIILVFFEANRVIYAQTENWRAYESPEKSFSVELPAPLMSIAACSGEHGVGYKSEEKVVGMFLYADKQPTEDESKFCVAIIDTKSKEFKEYDSIPRNELIEYLSIMAIGDDDDPTPDSEKEVESNGLKGREYIWERGEIKTANRSTFSLLTRGRIFDIGDKICILIYIGNSAADLKSPAAERFFNSFRLLKKK